MKAKSPKRTTTDGDCASTVVVTCRAAAVYFLRRETLWLGATIRRSRGHMPKRPGGRARWVSSKITSKGCAAPAFSRTLSCTVANVLRLLAPPEALGANGVGVAFILPSLLMVLFWRLRFYVTSAAGVRFRHVSTESAPGA